MEQKKWRTNNQLDGISKGRVQQPTEGLSQTHRNLFSRERQDGGEGDNGEEVEDENRGWVPTEFAADDGDWDDEEKEVDIVYVCAQGHGLAETSNAQRDGYAQAPEEDAGVGSRPPELPLRCGLGSHRNTSGAAIG